MRTGSGSKKTRVLVIAAHPDDEVLGCGAAMAWHAAQGEEVRTLILTDGAGGRYARAMRKTLRDSAQRSARILGIEGVTFLDLPNQGLDTLPITDVAQAVEKILADLRPQVVYTHHKGDLNRDHRIAYEATMVACRPLPGCPVARLLTYYVPSSSDYHEVDAESVFVPNVFLDAKRYLRRKLNAFLCYRSEVKAFPHPRSPEALEAYSRAWGVRVGLESAEPFRLIREIGGD